MGVKMRALCPTQLAGHASTTGVATKRQPLIQFTCSSHHSNRICEGSMLKFRSQELSQKWVQNCEIGVQLTWLAMLPQQGQPQWNNHGSNSYMQDTILTGFSRALTTNLDHRNWAINGCKNAYVLFRPPATAVMAILKELPIQSPHTQYYSDQNYQGSM